MVRPLPKGEGRGEGKETTARLHNRLDAARLHSSRAHLPTSTRPSHHHCPRAKFDIWCLRIVWCLVFFINTLLSFRAGSGPRGKPASTRPVRIRPRLSARARGQRASAFSPRQGSIHNAPVEVRETPRATSVPSA